MTLDEELEDSVLYARAIYQHNEGVATRDVFFFADGAVVFWNMAESEQKAILKVLDSVTESVSYCKRVIDELFAYPKNRRLVCLCNRLIW